MGSIGGEVGPREDVEHISPSRVFVLGWVAY